MPGLTEMHAHIPVAKAGNDSLVKETLFLYLSQGVTTIRGMLGDPYHLGLKKEVAAGTILGPRIYTSSPSLNGNSVTTKEEAIEKVTQYKKDGYDFLKIHPGIQFHVPIDVGVHRALEASYQTIDHLDGFLEGLVPISAKVNPADNGFFGYGFTNLADVNLIPALVEKTKQQGVAVVPTQTLFLRWFSPQPAIELANEPEMQYMSSKMLYTWRQSKERLLADSSYTAEQWATFIEIRNKLLVEMHQKGVTFLLGSDAPQVFNVPGFSLHREMKAMVEVGIPAMKVLQSGTSNPAHFFKAAGEYGTIEVGAAADLILLEANPLEDIGNAQKISGVMVKGKWLSKAMIAEELAAIAGK